MAAVRRVVAYPPLNFALTNRIPRAALTRWVGRISKIEHPWLCRASIAVWRMFTDLDLSDARQQRFRSLHHCFTRELVEGARGADPDPSVLASPSDGIVGACGSLTGIAAMQVKGSTYGIDELLADSALAEQYRDGSYVTLRLTSAMYHRFHSPCDGLVQRLDYIAGDCWNVNPVALARVSRLYCRNERAVLRLQLAQTQHEIAIVPVAAILVASMRFRFVDAHVVPGDRSNRRYDCQVPVAKGQELGHFEHGSTIVVFAPRGMQLAPGVETGRPIRAGAALMRLP